MLLTGLLPGTDTWCMLHSMTLVFHCIDTHSMGPVIIFMVTLMKLLIPRFVFVIIHISCRQKQITPDNQVLSVSVVGH